MPSSHATPAPLDAASFVDPNAPADPEVPVDPTERISAGLRLIIEQSVLNNERIARSLQVNVVDLQTFGLIARQSAPLTPRDIIEYTGLPSSTTTRVLDRLEAAAFITRTNDPTDRRKVLVAAVPEKSLELLEHYRDIVAHIAALNALRSPAELDTIASYLEALVAPPT